MKKVSIALLLFVVVFVATYLVICFAIPGMRIDVAVFKGVCYAEKEVSAYVLERIG